MVNINECQPLEKPVFHLAIFLREQAKSECDLVVMSSVFFASQLRKLLFCLFARTNYPRVENRLKEQHATTI